MSTRPLLAHFGAGNIGRSLVGQLFSAAGWDVTFLDVSPQVVEALNREHGYTVTVKDDILPGQPSTIPVRNVSGILLSDEEAVLDLLRRADLAGSSVGAANLPAVCAHVARAATLRERPLSLLLCENLHNAAGIARNHFEEALGEARPPVAVGFVEAAISKMVPATPEAVRRTDPLAVWAEAYNTLYLDADAYTGVPPTVPGVAWRRDFAAYVDRKLLIHNFGHAAAAYNGFLAGKTYIWECMEDEGVLAETRGCMLETARGLAVRHSGVFTFDELRAWVDDLLRRFHNRALADPVSRVGRDLLRKLSPDDRCIGALRLLRETGVDARHTTRAIAAGMLFAPLDEKGEAFPQDSNTVAQISTRGPELFLEEHSGLNSPHDREAVLDIVAVYRCLRQAHSQACQTHNR